VCSSQIIDDYVKRKRMKDDSDRMDSSPAYSRFISEQLLQQVMMMVVMG
jgi:hypothetical protein